MELVEALQSTSTNQAELKAFCPLLTTVFNDEEQVSKTYLLGVEVVVGSWVYQDVNGGYSTLEDEFFQKMWQPGGGP